ncbi:hypothetical protein ACCW76_18250 [Pantoea sp. C8B4]|uniref:Rz1-like lysis system protein LysC n=1 Tax=Pantoea sp. C8B4 TaxID=3243083 RepID=UPI003EDADE5C
MLLSLFLMTQLSSCVRTETKYVSAPAVPLPESLLSDCTVPELPEHFTWGASLELNEKLLTELQNCNRDKAAIREIEDARHSVDRNQSNQ